MAPRPHREGALLGLLGVALALCCLPLGSMGRVILVTDPSDKGGSCPGPSCTLQAAWNATKLNDTILLNVSASLSGRLYRSWYNKPESPTYYSTITIAAARPGLKVSGTKNHGFLGLMLNKQRINVVLQGFAISGFNASSDISMICLDQGSDYYHCGSSAGLPRPSSPTGAVRARQTTQAQRSLWWAKGEVPKPYSVFLTMTDMEISHNYYKNDKDTGLIYTNCIWDCSAVYNGVVLKSNTIDYTHSLRGVLHFGLFNMDQPAPLPAISLYMSNVEVLDNFVADPGRQTESPDGLFYFVGDIYAKNLQVASNTMGQGLGVLYTGAQTFHNYVGDIYMEDSSFASNTVFRQSSQGTWTLTAFHTHLKQVTIEAPQARVSWTVDDQYFSSCTLSSSNGAVPLIHGWQFFNRDPYHPLKALSSNLGFANCTEAAPWLPCPNTAPTCTNLLNSGGATVGYSCN